jgi:hypothetical protein
LYRVCVEAHGTTLRAKIEFVRQEIESKSTSRRNADGTTFQSLDGVRPSGTPLLGNGGGSDAAQIIADLVVQRA